MAAKFQVAVFWVQTPCNDVVEDFAAYIFRVKSVHRVLKQLSLWEQNPKCVTWLAKPVNQQSFWFRN
jgi:hypothetical protein